MRIGKNRGIAALCTLLIIITGTAIVIGYFQRANAEPPAGEDHSLAQQKLRVAQEGLNLATEFNKRGLGPKLEDLDRWARRVMDAKIALATTDQERATATQDYLAHTKEIESLTKEEFKAGLATQLDVEGATYARIEAHQLEERKM